MSNKIQKNYNELKKKSELTDKFIKLVDSIKFDDEDIPKTEKGMSTKAKELIDRLNKKLEKDEKSIGKKKRKNYYIKKKDRKH